MITTTTIATCLLQTIKFISTETNNNTNCLPWPKWPSLGKIAILTWAKTSCQITFRICRPIRSHSWSTGQCTLVNLHHVADDNGVIILDGSSFSTVTITCINSIFVIMRKLISVSYQRPITEVGYSH